MKKIKFDFSDGNNKIDVDKQLYKFIANYILESYISKLIRNENNINGGE